MKSSREIVDRHLIVPIYIYSSYPSHVMEPRSAFAIMQIVHHEATCHTGTSPDVFMQRGIIARHPRHRDKNSPYNTEA